MSAVEPKRIILLDIPMEDFEYATATARWLIHQPSTQRDGVLAYGPKAFYVRRNKTSITVRPC